MAPSTSLFTGWATLALAAAGVDPARSADGRPTALAYLRRTLSIDREPGDLERTILAVRAAGANPSDFGGRDLTSLARPGNRPGRLGRGADEPDRVRGAGAARGREVDRRRGRSAGSSASRTPTAASTSRRPPGRATSTIRAPCSRRSPLTRPARTDRTCRRLHPRPRRTATAASLTARRGFERPIDRLCDRGADRRRRQPSEPASRRRAFADRVSELPDRARWARSVRRRQQPDPGLGHRAGAPRTRASAPAAPDGLGSASASCVVEPVNGARRVIRSFTDVTGSTARREKRTNV